MTPNRPDPYTVLGVASSATQAEISRAYRALLLQHHPDTRTPGDEAHDAMSDLILQRVVSAYQIVRDPHRRASHDCQAGPHLHGRRTQTQDGTNPDGGYAQPPIVAGPVRWHPAPDPPQP